MNNYNYQESSSVFSESLFLYIVFLVLLIFVLSIVAYLIIDYIKKDKYEKSKIARSINMVLYRVMVQKGGMGKDKEEDDKKGVKEFAAKASQFLASLYSIKDSKISSFNYSRGAFVSFEIVSHEEKIVFYVAAPKQLAGMVEKQIHGFYPEAIIEETARHNIFEEKNDYSAAELILAEDSVLPIKNYKEFEEDTINAITTALSKMSQEEGAAIQFVIRPTSNKWQKNSEYYIKKLQEGKSIKEGASFKKVGESVLKFGGELSRAALETPDSNKKDDKPKTATPLGEQQIKLISDKMSFVGFETLVRVVVSSPNKASAKMHLANIIASFSVYSNALGNRFIANKKAKEPKIIEDFIFRHCPYTIKSILNVEELASVFHFPNRLTETPNIVWLKSKRAPAPPEVPKTGIFLGYNNYRGVKMPIYMKPKDRVRHTYVIGKTGTGKSTLMREMMVQDIKNGEGVCYIDPHGTDIEMLLERIPKERIDDVILFDPGDFERPLSLNLLEYSRPEEKTLAVGELLNVFDKLYDLRANGGPMFEQYFRNAALLVMEDPESGSTLLEIPKVLADEDFRAFKLSRCKNPIIKNYWLKEAEKAGGDAALANIVPYITSKMTQFLANDIMRPIITQQKSSFNFRDIMDNKKILLVKLSKGQIGEMNAYLLGLLVISKIYLAAMSRVDIPEEKRNPFYLYIDEFQNFTTDSVMGILSEARKYQLALTIAHQYINQLIVKGDDRIKQAVFGNVGTFVTFRVGEEDAEYLKTKYEPVFSAYDIANIENNNAYISLLSDNTSLRPFSINVFVDFEKIKREESNPKIKEAIMQLSRLKYGRNREEVEEEIRDRA